MISPNKIINFSQLVTFKYSNSIILASFFAYTTNCNDCFIILSIEVHCLTAFCALSKRSRFHLGGTCNNTKSTLCWASVRVMWGVITTMLNSAYFYFHTKYQIPFIFFVLFLHAFVAYQMDERKKKESLHAIKMNVS